MTNAANTMPTENPDEEASDLRVRRQSRWLKLCLQWHWISSGLAVFGMLLFAITGVTLNHAGQIGSNPDVVVVEDQLPEALVQKLASYQGKNSRQTPQVLTTWLSAEHGISLTEGALEWTAYELYVSSPRPGGDAWLSVDFDTGELVYEETDRGWIAWLNDLHKGRNTGAVWIWFIDLFAFVCVVFCVTGFGVLWIHSRERAQIWPVVGAGILVPILLAALFVH